MSGTVSQNHIGEEVVERIAARAGECVAALLALWTEVRPIQRKVLAERVAAAVERVLWEVL